MILSECCKATAEISSMRYKKRFYTCLKCGKRCKIIKQKDKMEEAREAREKEFHDHLIYKANPDFKKLRNLIKKKNEYKRITKKTRQRIRK